MKWALWILVSIAGIIAIVTVIGITLPRDHVATRTAVFKASPDSIWSAMTDAKSFPKWRSDVANVEELPTVNGKRSWRESAKGGSITYVAEVEEAPRKLVTSIATTDLPFGGSWIHTIVPEGSGSRVTITERGWVSNPLFRFVSRFVLGQTATMESYLRALGKRFGETVTPATT